MSKMGQEATEHSFAPGACWLVNKAYSSMR